MISASWWWDGLTLLIEQVVDTHDLVGRDACQLADAAPACVEQPLFAD